MIIKHLKHKYMTKVSKEPKGNEANTMLAAASFNWVSIFLKKPIEGQKVASRVANEQGYVGECIYTNGYFETYHDRGNRFEITRWKHDEWAAL